MTATNHDTTERDKTTQMAEALIAHLGSGPAASILSSVSCAKRKVPR